MRAALCVAVAVVGVLLAAVSAVFGHKVISYAGSFLCAALYVVATVALVRHLWRSEFVVRRSCAACGGEAVTRAGVGLWFCSDEHMQEWDDAHSY